MQEEKITAGVVNLNDMTPDVVVTDCKAATLFGVSNGQLEFVSMTTMTRRVGNRWQKFVTMRFTDHDLEAVSLEDLRTMGLNPYYELTFPIA